MNNHPKTLKRNLFFPDQDEHPEILLEEKLKEMDMIIKGLADWDFNPSAKYIMLHGANNIFLEQT